MKSYGEPMNKSEPLATGDVDKIRQTSMYSSIPEEIRAEFERFGSYNGVKTAIHLPNGREANIFFVEPLRRSQKSNFDLYLRFTVTWLRFVSRIASPSCAQSLNIYILLTDLKKSIPASTKEPIDHIHSNTAFTTSCSSKNDIFIYRREEWLKVLFHESFHCLGLDFSAEPAEESNRRIVTAFPAVNPGTDIRLYESYCETWAEIMNIMFCLFTTKTGKILPFSTRRFSAVLKKEQRFSIQQSNKLLKRAGYRYKDLFSRPPPNKDFYRENTNAFSYYVIKSVLLSHIDEFVNWCQSNYARNEIHQILQFPKELNSIRNSGMNGTIEVGDRVGNYCELVERLAINDRYLSAVKNSKPNASKTMRMTSIDPLWISR